jgi:uncharacterized protein HemX
MSAESIIATILAALIAASPGLYALYIQRDNNRANAAQTYQAIADKAATRQDAMEKEIDDLRKSIFLLQKRLDRRDRIISDWQVGISRLLAQFKSHNIVPVWTPAPIELDNEQAGG